ncbi:tyrosine-type recombinase/integrase [Pseudophaeobacter sp.]|uniref:tyrosine-type recombinase/integrase n=1 Tax=Pseudophaeobacter sp. TaxID=1971739 RepID=UPI003297366B
MIGNKPIQQVTDGEWTAFNNMLFKLQSNLGKPPLHKEQHCFEIIEREKKKKARELCKAEITIKKERVDKDDAEALREKARFKKVAPRTVQRHQGNLRSALNHAVKLGVISHNSYKSFVLSEKAIDELRNARPETSRMLWLDEFKDLLGKDKWTSEKTEIDDPLCWGPIIARLHGLRSEEILQLKPKNVRSDDGLLFFDIERGTGQSAKSNNARRFVPIHSQLLELGFMELVERQKNHGKRRVFDKVARSESSKKTFTATFTKKFTYYRKTRKIYEQRLDFHALRTTFNSRTVGYAIPDTASRYMMGHKNEDVGIVNYLPEGFPLKTLKSLIELEQIDLSVVSSASAKLKSHAPAPISPSMMGLSWMRGNLPEILITPRRHNTRRGNLLSTEAVRYDQVAAEIDDGRCYYCRRKILSERRNVYEDIEHYLDKSKEYYRKWCFSPVNLLISCPCMQFRKIHP